MAAQTTEPLFDLASYARRGPGRRDRLSPGQVAQVARTVRSAPEVMVKVLSHGGQDLKAVGRHFDYLRDREGGEVPLQTDDGQQLAGQDASKKLLEDWDLDLEELRASAQLNGRGRESRKLVHKVLFSMPAGTPSEKVLAAVKNLAREEFALKHRYAMVLHTDEPHPHVHLVVKAVSEQGARLHIRKATLREWRRQFALQLRNLGIDANATSRAIRGVTEPRKLDGIYRAAHDPKHKRHSTHLRTRLEDIAEELRAGPIRVEAGKSRLVATREQVKRGWAAISEILIDQRELELAAHIGRFVAQMPPPLTEKEYFAARLLERQREFLRPRQGKSV